MPPSRGDEPGESGVLPSEPLSDVLAAITVTEDGRTLTGRTRSMRRPSTQPEAQPIETVRDVLIRYATGPHEHTRTPTETSNHVMRSIHQSLLISARHLRPQDRRLPRRPFPPFSRMAFSGGRIPRA